MKYIHVYDETHDFNYAIPQVRAASNTFIGVLYDKRDVEAKNWPIAERALNSEEVAALWRERVLKG